MVHPSRKVFMMKKKHLAIVIGFLLPAETTYAKEYIYNDYFDTNGIVIKRGDSAVVTGDSSITAPGNGSSQTAPIYLGKSTSLRLEGAGVFVGNGNFGIFAESNAVIDINNSRVDTFTHSPYSQNAVQLFGGGSTLKIYGNKSLITGNIGIKINGNNSTVDATDHATILGVTKDAIESTGSNSVINISDGSYLAGKRRGIVAKGDNANIQISDSTVTAIDDVGILLASKEGILNVENSTITGGSDAITASGSGSYVSIQNSSIHGGNGLTLWGGANASLTNSTVHGEKYFIEFIATENGLSSADVTSSAVSGGVHLKPSSGGYNSGTLNLADTTWTGYAETGGDDSNEKPSLTINLNENSYWNNIADSTLTVLGITESTVNMKRGDINTQFLQGNNSANQKDAFILSNYNVESKRANTLSAEKSSGLFTVGMDSSRSGAAGLMYGNVILHVLDASESYFKTMLSDVGVYRYQSYVVNNADGSTDVVLGNPQNPDITNPAAPPQNPDITNPAAPPQNPDITNPAAPPQNPGNRPPELSTSAQTVVNTRAAAVTLWRDEEDALNLRMDYNRRTGEKNAHGVWGSYYGSYTRQQMDGASSGFDQKNQGFMLGYDKQFELNNGNLLAGLSVMRGSSDVSMEDKASTRSRITGNSGTVYGSFRHHNGLFVDGSVKASRLENDLSVTSLDGGKSSASYDAVGFGGRLKAGVQLQPLNSLFVQPYASLSYVRFSGIDYRLSNGLHARDSGYESLRSEAGVNVGTQWSLKNGSKIAPYIHAAVADEMAKSNKMNMNGIEVNDSTDGPAGIVGLGVDVAFKSGLGGYVGANYTKGENHEKPWQVNAGITYSW